METELNNKAINYLTAEQNKKIASKLLPILRLIEFYEIKESLALSAYASSQTERAGEEIKKCSEKLSDLFIDAIVYDYQEIIDNVYCVLMNSDEIEDLNDSLRDLGIK